MLFDILALISTLVIITLLKRLVNIFPSLVACTIRWKESVNLDSSVKNAYDRDIIAMGMVLPFCLAVSRFRLYTPSFMDGMDESIRLCVTIGIFIIYDMVRRLASMMTHNRKNKKIYDVAQKSSYTFFIILSIILVALGGIMSFCHVGPETTRIAMLWVSAFIYTLSLLRKTQIFLSGFSKLTCFLYLCGLEIIPTGLLIAPVLIF